MTQNRLGALYLSLAAGIWGGMYVVSKFALAIVPPFTLIFARYFVALLLLVLLCIHKKQEIIPVGGRLTLFQVGFFGYFLSMAGQFIGTKLSSAHMGAMVTSLSPLFQSGFALLILKERITARQTLAIILSFLGILVITGAPGPGEENGQLGIFFLLLAALFWGYYSVLAKKLSATHSPLQITTAGILLATAMTLPVSAYEAKDLSLAAMLTWPVTLSVLYLGVVSTAVAFFCWNKGISLMPAHQSGLFFFLQPVVGSLLGWAFLGEQLTVSFLGGSFFILIGVYLSMTNK